MMNNRERMDLLVKLLLDGDQDKSTVEARKLREAGVKPELIITAGIEKAMACLDAKCTVEEFNLLEIMLCGRAVMGVMKEIYPPGAPPPQPKGTVVIAALEGDIHDLGKNIVEIVLTAVGYKVVDCGKDCPLVKVLDAAEQEAALAIGISGLITTIIPQVRQLKDILIERGLEQIKVLAGGAVLKQASAESLNVDYVAQSAFDGFHYLNKLLKEDNR